jgi:hypothetical protein
MTQISGPIDPDETPEAPAPSPTLSLYLRVVENDAANDFDGGRLVMKPVRAGIDPAIMDASLVIASKTDGFLTRFPWKTRAAKQGRFYRLTVEEVPESELPPDPEVEARKAQLERELAALQLEAGGPAALSAGEG